MTRLAILPLLMLLIFPAGCISSLLFFPEKELRDSPVLRKFPHEDVYFKTSDGITLHGWWFRTSGEPRGTVLFFHGNAENISTHVHNVLWLVEGGYDLFTFDYRGYGRSEGEPDIPGIHRDGEAALETILKLRRSEGSGVTLLGQSLGGAVAVYTAANAPEKKAIRAVILDSTLSGYQRIAQEKLKTFLPTRPFRVPLSRLLDDTYSPDRWMSRLGAPVLILHGDRDTTIPVSHGTILFQSASEPKTLWILEGKGHIEGFLDPEVRRRVLAYLAGLETQGWRLPGR